MSLDTVDDLHAAEDRIGVLEEHIRKIAQGWEISTVLLLRAPCGDAVNSAVAVIDGEPYCRPSCHSWEAEGCDRDECGCPCHNREVNDG